MISSRRKSDEKELNPDLTPLLDIIFIVMVFLLLSANIQIQALKVSIPQTDTNSQLAPADELTYTVSVPADKDTWGLQDKSFSDWSAFVTAFIQAKTEHPKRAFIIASDKDASVEKLLKLFKFMQSHNIQATNIIMESSTQ